MLNIQTNTIAAIFNHSKFFLLLKAIKASLVIKPRPSGSQKLIISFSYCLETYSCNY